jgi:hypothetical protein
MYVREMIENLARSAPSLGAADLERIRILVESIRPARPQARAQCDVLAGLLAGAITDGSELTAELAGAAKHLVAVLHPPAAWTELDERVVDVLCREAFFRRAKKPLGDLLARSSSADAAALRSALRARGIADADQPRTRSPRAPAKPVRPWLDEAKLPRLFHSDGRPVDLFAMRSILHLQSKAPGPELDPEVEDLRETVDRERSGDFALAVLHLFLAEEKITDKFCIPLAAAFGDDRAVAILERKILEWPELRRQKLAELAIRALGLHGPPSSLFALDSIARRLRTFRRPQAEVARRALEGVDRGAGVDDALPRYGFDRRKRIAGAPKRSIEVRIGPDFRLSYTDEEGRPMKALSRMVPEPEREAIGDLSKAMRHIVRSHALRLEDAMIAGRSWPHDRWTSLFLGHPILFGFAVRCVFGLYRSDGARIATFRALEDETLTSHDDEPVELREGVVRLLHPAIEPEACDAWAAHLADYGIEQPFPQVSRPRIRVAEADRSVRFCRALEGRPFDPFERARFARRLGWKALGYDASTTGCYKTFPGREDIDVVLHIDPAAGRITGHTFSAYDDSALEDGRIFRAENEDDPRYLALGEVPPAIYAEATSELERLLTG